LTRLISIISPLSSLSLLSQKAGREEDARSTCPAMVQWAQTWPPHGLWRARARLAAPGSEARPQPASAGYQARPASQLLRGSQLLARHRSLQWLSRPWRVGRSLSSVARGARTSRPGCAAATPAVTLLQGAGSRAKVGLEVPTRLRSHPYVFETSVARSVRSSSEWRRGTSVRALVCVLVHEQEIRASNESISYLFTF